MTMTPLAAAQPRPAALVRQQAAGAPAAPAIRARAQGGDPLPKFSEPTDYQHYVINLVAQAQGTERELEAARKALNQGGEGTKAVVETLQERLDAIKLQLKILRDDYPLPAEWTRSKLLFGYGFDKEAFWKAQVEAIPGQEVVVPRPAPKPEAPKPPAPANVPAPAPAPASNGPRGDLPAPLVKLLAGYADEGLRCNNNSGGNALSRSKLEAMLPILAGKTDPAARQAEQFVRETLRGFDGNYTETHYAYRAAHMAVKSLLTGSGTLQERHDQAIRALVAEGETANNNSGGNLYARARLVAIQRHAGMGDDERSKQIAALSTQVLRGFDGNYTETHHAYKTTFASFKALMSGQGTIDERKKGAVGAFAAEGLTANNNSGGNLFARARLTAISRLVAGSADPTLQTVGQLVNDTLRAHDGNYTQTYNAYVSTFQAVKAMLA
jgi:hypothetical protein